VSVSSLDRGMGARTPLERCTGDPSSFLLDVWGRRASLTHPVAGSAGFDDLLALDDVDRCVTSVALRTPFFRVVKAGERIDEDRYTRSGRAGSRDVHGMVDPARLASLFEAGATLVLQGLHRWSEPVARFTRDLELELGYPCQVNAYITPPGAQGLDLHADPHDVFVLQAFGRKRWEVHGAPGEAHRDPLELDLDPGDTVYMPAGTPHAAAAQQVVSGHLTVGVHVTSWSDVVRDALGSQLASIEGNVPAGWHHDADAFARDLRDRLDAVATSVHEVDAVRAAGSRVERFLSNRAQLARGSFAERTEPLEIDDETVVRRRPGSVCEPRLRDGVLVALLGDRRLEMPPWLEPAMRWIAASDGFRVGELSLVVPEPASRVVLVRRLAREGLLTTRIVG
jgi:bifunctional lysine-specific demethylase and histidyl-hydroxylase NO66